MIPIELLKILNWKGWLFLILLLAFISLATIKTCSQITEDKYEEAIEVEYDTIDDYRSLCLPITGKPCTF
jgi:hypothetical protein